MAYERDNTPAEPSNRLFVGGLAWAATDEDLKKAFEAFGQVTSAQVAIDKISGRSRGFGFVEFSTVEEATEAKEKVNTDENFMISGRRVNADFARQRRE